MATQNGVAAAAEEEQDEPEDSPESGLQRLMKAGKRPGAADALQNHHGGSFQKYMAAKVQKLERQYEDQRRRVSGGSGTPEARERLPGIFDGVAIHVNGFTTPPHEELKHIMARHGGKFINYVRPNAVTHIICSNYSDASLKRFETQRKPPPVVRPEWITDSIQAGRLLQVEGYLLSRLRDVPGQRLLSGFATDPGKQQKQKEEELGSMNRHADDDATPSRHGGGCHQGAAPASPGTVGASDVRGSGRDRPHVEGGGSLATAIVRNGDCVPGISRDLREASAKEQVMGSRTAQAGHRTVMTGLATGGNRAAETGGGGAEEEEELGVPAAAVGGMSTGDERSPVQNRGTGPSSGGGGSGPVGHHQASGSKAHHQSPLSKEDLSLRMAQRVAERARANCDVLKMGVRSSREDPNFMETFYKSSRLHFIGTWKARNEALVEKLSGSGPQPSVQLPIHRRLQLPSTTAASLQRTVIHLDMDAFFASVAGLEHPSLSGKPLAVSHSNSNASNSGGEISSANYAARGLGIRAGMWMGEAKRLCPELLVMPYQFEKYQEISDKVYSIMLKYTAVVQPVSCDEAFLDVTGLGDAQSIARQMRIEIHEATGCTASAGIGPNMLVARLATKKAKPDGQFEVSASGASAFVQELPVTDLPGVGWKLSKKLKALGIGTCADVLRFPRDLKAILGEKTGMQLKEFASSRDDREVKPPGARKSVGAEVNWGVRFETKAEANEFLEGLGREVSSRLKEAGFVARSITLKLKRRAADAPVEPRKFLGHGVCDNLSKSTNLPRLSDDPAEISRSAKHLLAQLRVLPDQIRGIGISMSRLEPSSGNGSAAAGEGGVTALDRFLVQQPRQPQGPQRQHQGQGQAEAPGGAAAAPKDAEQGLREKQLQAASGGPGRQGNEDEAEEEPGEVKESAIDDGEGAGVVNPAVLAALPEEMQKQILSSSNIVGRTAEHQHCQRQHRGSSAAAGLETAVAGAAAAHVGNDIEEALPPASQLDPAVLEQLPPEYVEQLRMAYSARELNQQQQQQQVGSGGGSGGTGAASGGARGPLEWWKQPRAASGGFLGSTRGGRGNNRGASTYSAAARNPAQQQQQQRRPAASGAAAVEAAPLAITLSQIDPDVLAELPAEFQAEVMANLREAARPVPRNQQQQHHQNHQQQQPQWPSSSFSPLEASRGAGTPPQTPPMSIEARTAQLIAELGERAKVDPGLRETLQGLLRAAAGGGGSAGEAPVVPDDDEGGTCSILPGPDRDSSPALMEEADPALRMAHDDDDEEEEEKQKQQEEEKQDGSSAMVVALLAEVEEVLADWGTQELPCHADDVRSLLMEMKRAAARFPELQETSGRLILRLQEEATRTFGGPLSLRSMFEPAPTRVVIYPKI